MNITSNRTKGVKQMYIIGIDHGNDSIKTVNYSFKSGGVASEHPPYTTKDVLEYKNRYYVCGSGRQGLTKNKTENENYYILTLAGIAKEIEYRHIDRTCDVLIAAGLPLSAFSKGKEPFIKYLTSVSPVKFKYENKHYKINIVGAKLFPQGYSAIAYQNNLLRQEPSQILVDIGGWTVDCMMINNGRPDEETCRSREFGAIRCIETIQEEIRRELDLAVTPAQIEQVLLNKPCSLDKQIKKIIIKQGAIYTRNLFKMLEESGLDTRAVPTILMGGGAHIAKPYVEDRNIIKIITDRHANAKGYEIIAEQVIKNGN